MSTDLVKMEGMDVDLLRDFMDEIELEVGSGTAFRVKPNRLSLLPGGGGFTNKATGELLTKIGPVIVGYAAITRAMWKQEAGNSPLCFSTDGGVTGTPTSSPFLPAELRQADGTPLVSRKCAGCPFTKFVSSGVAGQKPRPPCKEMRSLVIVPIVDGELASIPQLLNCPPKSHKSWDTYVTGLLGNKKYYPTVVTEFSVIKMQDGVVEFGIVDPKFVRDATVDELREIQARRPVYKALIGVVVQDDDVEDEKPVVESDPF